MARSTTKRTTSKRSTTKRTTPAASAAAKGLKVKSGAPAPTVVQDTPAVVSGPELRKKELLNRVLARSGAKRKDAKPVVEAMLAVLADALGSGEEVNLKPLGKIKVNRQKELSNATVLNCRLRIPKDVPAGDATTAKDPLAEPAE